jgi:hypothetical protein
MMVNVLLKNWKILLRQDADWVVFIAPPATRVKIVTLRVKIVLTTAHAMPRMNVTRVAKLATIITIPLLAKHAMVMRF